MNNKDVKLSLSTYNAFKNTGHAMSTQVNAIFAILYKA